jgi:hypothetical protein
MKIMFFDLFVCCGFNLQILSCILVNLEFHLQNLEIRNEDASGSLPGYRTS